MLGAGIAAQLQLPVAKSAVKAIVLQTRLLSIQLVTQILAVVIGPPSPAPRGAANRR